MEKCKFYPDKNMEIKSCNVCPNCLPEDTNDLIIEIRTKHGIIPVNKSEL